MSESGYYAPGTENDPRAPWNQPEPVECPDCEGEGVQTCRELDGSITEEKCSKCEGEGYVDPREIEDDGPDPDYLRDCEFDRQMNGDEW